MTKKLNDSGTYPPDLLDLSRMNRVMRHRLRNLCCGMKMALDRIAEQTQGTQPGIGDNCAIMQSELLNLLGFTTRMDLLFDELPEPEARTLFQILTSARQFFAENFPFCDIELNGPEADVQIPHGSLLQTAIEELLKNAGEACFENAVKLNWEFNGKLKICVENANESEAQLEDIPTSPPQPFCTNRGRHDGLGLAITQRICNAMGGSFAFDCKDGIVQATIDLPKSATTTS